jgi:hypothetical protein
VWREHRRNAQAREGVGSRCDVQRSHVDGEEATWPGKRMSARELISSGMGEQCRADAASHGSIQVGHVCETRESGLTDGARMAVRGEW